MMGNTWNFGNNINTDLITPGRYNLSMDPVAMAKICFVEYRPEFAKQVKKGDFLVAGANFGCGSSRETAVMAIKACGVRAILAKSFARIFYRNCVNSGMLAVEMDTDGISEGDEIELDEKKMVVKNLTKKTEISIKIPRAMLTLEHEGGITNFIKKNGFGAMDGLFAD
jgi:3-isopropylmalate/(R)-2-methylmalate dehydratase small subunit